MINSSHTKFWETFCSHILTLLENFLIFLILSKLTEIFLKWNQNLYKILSSVWFGCSQHSWWQIGCYQEAYTQTPSSPQSSPFYGWRRLHYNVIIINHPIRFIRKGLNKITRPRFYFGLLFINWHWNNFSFIFETFSVLIRCTFPGKAILMGDGYHYNVCKFEILWISSILWVSPIDLHSIEMYAQSWSFSWFHCETVMNGSPDSNQHGDQVTRSESH